MQQLNPWQCATQQIHCQMWMIQWCSVFYCTTQWGHSEQRGVFLYANDMSPHYLHDSHQQNNWYLPDCLMALACQAVVPLVDHHIEIGPVYITENAGIAKGWCHCIKKSWIIWDRIGLVLLH